MTSVIQELLPGFVLFRALSDDALACLAAGSKLRDYAPDQVLWTAGQTPAGLYAIAQGTVRILRGQDGRQHVVHTEQAGATIGEIPLFDGGPYPATAVAATRVRCVFVPADTLEAAMRLDPELSLRLLAHLSRRVRHLVEQLSRTTLQSVRTRLAAYLLERAATNSNTVTLGSTQSVLAEQLGTVREVVARELAQLRRRGILRTLGGNRYEITDRPALERAAQGDER